MRARHRWLALFRASIGGGTTRTLIADIANSKMGGSFSLTGRIGNPPRLEDFAELREAHENLAALPRCRVGACDSAR
jgi:hypothetical protein